MNLDGAINMVIVVLDSQTLDLFADQAEEGPYERHDLQMKQPVADVQNWTTIDAALEGTGPLTNSEPFPPVSANGSAVKHENLAVRSQGFKNRSCECVVATSSNP